MRKVTGIGGVFFKSRDPKALKAWYAKHLGIKADEHGAIFRWRAKEDPARFGHTVWSPFPENTQYFEPSVAPYMINYRVENLRALLDELRGAGVWVDDRIEESSYGTFGWIRDPEGVRIELWQPPSDEDKHFGDPS